MAVRTLNQTDLIASTNDHFCLNLKTKYVNDHKLLQVTAEVFAPGSKKSIVKIDGEWNGKMMAKYASGCNEVFMDVSKIPIHKKICRKVAEQVCFDPLP